MTKQEQANQITLLLMVMVASASNVDYCGHELMKIPLTNKIVRHEVKMLFNQFRTISDKLSSSMMSKFEWADVDSLNSLAQDILDASFCLTAAAPEQRRLLVEELAQKVEQQRINPAAA